MTKKESTTFHPFYTRGAGSIFERKQAFRVGELMARCKVAVQAEERGKKKKKDKKGQREAGTAQSSLKCRSSCRRFFPPCASSATSRVAPGINIVMRIMPKSRHGHRAPATATLKRHRCFMRWVTFCPNEITLPESPTVHGFLVKYRAAFLRTYAGMHMCPTQTFDGHQPGSSSTSVEPAYSSTFVVSDCFLAGAGLGGFCGDCQSGGESG